MYCDLSASRIVHALSLKDGNLYVFVFLIEQWSAFLCMFIQVSFDLQGVFLE